MFFLCEIRMSILICVRLQRDRAAVIRARTAEDAPISVTSLTVAAADVIFTAEGVKKVSIAS